jgi:hypothetical protein
MNCWNADSYCDVQVRIHLLSVVFVYFTTLTVCELHSLEWHDEW